MAKKNPVDLFIEMAERTLVHSKVSGLAVESRYEEEIAFHLIHLRLLEIEKREATRTRIAQWYPYIKINGRWRFMVPSFYMYLFYACQAIYDTGDKRMIKLGDAIRKATAYTDQVKRFQEAYQPKTFDNWDEYQEQQKSLYESHLAEQMGIFDEIKAMAVPPVL